MGGLGLYTALFSLPSYREEPCLAGRQLVARKIPRPYRYQSLVGGSGLEVSARVQGSQIVRRVVGHRGRYHRGGALLEELESLGIDGRETHRLREQGTCVGRGVYPRGAIHRDHALDRGLYRVDREASLGWARVLVARLVPGSYLEGVRTIGEARGAAQRDAGAGLIR